MSDHVIYVDRFRLREREAGGLQAIRNGDGRVRREERAGGGLLHYYVDEDGAEGTAVFVFSDAEALDVHLDVASSRFQEGYELLSATEIELLGRPSDRAIELATSFNASLKTKLAGFSR